MRTITFVFEYVGAGCLGCGDDADGPMTTKECKHDFLSIPCNWMCVNDASATDIVRS